HFSTAFGRGLDYYTGFVFELYAPRAQASEPLVAGGRYDGLLSRLGSARPISAVGVSVWIGPVTPLRGAPVTGPSSSQCQRKDACKRTRRLSSRAPASSSSNRAGRATTAAPSPISPASRWRIFQRPRLSIS